MAIDRFVLAKLEQKELRPAPAASKEVLIRRVYFDLTGLPPTPDEVQTFVNDDSPDAYEKLVDRLLDSSHYGERWGQHWLDVIRFAETEGFEYDRHIPGAWRFRDYVIDSFNRDKPFDQFIREQLAGDEIAPENPELETAAIFHRLGAIRRNAGNPEVAVSRNEVLTERTDIIGDAFLGLTIRCARCHDHKFDPIAQKDYYRLEAFFAASEEHNIVLASEEDQKKAKADAAALQDEIKRLKKQAQNATGKERTELERKIEALEDQEPADLPTIPSVADDPAHRTEIHVLFRGLWEKKGDKVGPRPPGILLPESAPEFPADIPKPRAALADWLVGPTNPLTARVIVNRIWQDHFGIGLVKTPNDFGTNGDRPSHPELLDWLARDFIEHGWRLKRLHRLILLSAASQQASDGVQGGRASEIDPDNRLLWKFNRRRLSAEEIRDAMLAVSGTLNLKAGGPSVMVPVDRELVALLYKPAQWKVARDHSEFYRRSIYLLAKRNLRLPFMEVFDAPILQTSCARRESSTHPPQALELLNGSLANELAATFADRLQRETSGNPDRMAERGFWLVAGRPPTAKERKFAADFLREGSPKEFALALLNLNTFLYVR